ncbi:YgiT-type zinc finger protein [Pseudoduganella sp.]|uniref:YgiT-type zinc finger protein n=1 Tax=Pseudoduganella sp. TaxID=1880898 RepID=UPI0035AE41E6
MLSHELCSSCGHQGLRLRRVTRSCGSGQDIVVIEHIPMVFCPHCGEGYFLPETLREIDRMKAQRDGFQQLRLAPVLAFPS